MKCAVQQVKSSAEKHGKAKNRNQSNDFRCYEWPLSGSSQARKSDTILTTTICEQLSELKIVLPYAITDQPWFCRNDSNQKSALDLSMPSAIECLSSLLKFRKLSSDGRRHLPCAGNYHKVTSTPTWIIHRQTEIPECALLSYQKSRSTAIFNQANSNVRSLTRSLIKLDSAVTFLIKRVNSIFPRLLPSNIWVRF